jgi:uncharacterized membrane protein YeaQ/YmgE (transglycosylase-associated protein family)
VAGLLGRMIGWYSPDEPAGIIASIIGAMLLLFIYRAATRNREAPHHLS